MESKIQKQIIDYFSYFDEFNNSVKNCLRDCQNCAATINKLIKRYKNIKEADVTGTQLEGFDNLQNKLCAVLHNLISNSVQEIRCKQTSLEEGFEKLCHKNKVLRESCRQIDFNEKSSLINGTPFQPSLKQLLEFADDTITFGSQACAQIDAALNILLIRKVETVSLGDHFRYPVNWNKRINEITTYTSFLTEN